MTQSTNTGAMDRSALAPTVVLGLGGLGREVVFRTRRRLYERYRKTSLPVLSFLWLDHDTDIDPTPELPARVARKVALAADDCLSLSLTDEQIGGLVLPDDTAQEPRSRFLGGAVLEANRAPIAAHLRQVAATIRSDESVARTEGHGFSVRTDRVEFVLVTSLAGGLGSGALAPLARLIREVCPDAHIRGVLFLSGLFMAHDIKRRRLAMANGFAAAREIQAAQNKADARPFDALHVVDRENAEGNRPIDPLEPLEMVAQSLALEFSRSDVGAAVRGLRYRSSEGGLFASFGLAAVAPGGGRLRSAAAYLLGAELLQRWSEGPGRPDAAAVGLPDGWPEEQLTAAAQDLREEYDTYDIPPVEERNQPLAAPEDLRPLFFEHLRHEMELPSDATDETVLDRVAERFQARSEERMRSHPRPGGQPWERLMDRLERFCLTMSSRFDARVAEAFDPGDAEDLDETVAALRSWSEPWSPLTDGESDRTTFTTVLGTGLRDDAPIRSALNGETVCDYHPGTIVRYRETSALPPQAFATLTACRDEYRVYAKEAGDRLGHRYTCTDWNSLPDLF